MRKAGRKLLAAAWHSFAPLRPKCFAMAFAVAFAFYALGANGADSLTMDDFAHKIKLQVNGYTGTETLSNFPVLVRISESGIPGFLYSETSAKNAAGTTYGYDVAFFAEDGTRLASENDTWVHNGESLAWVKLPQMTQGTKFYMCYNVASGVMVENPNPWEDFVGVWHMKDEGGRSKPIKDSTLNMLDGVTAGTGSPGQVADGRVGKARHIATDSSNNPGKDSGITIDLSDSAKRAVVDDLDTEFTASMWVRVTADFNYFYLISRKNADGYAAWGAQTLNDTKGTTRMWASNDGEGGVAKPVLGVALAAKNQWHKIDFIWKSNGTYEVYQDGGNKLTGNLAATAVQGSLNLSLGGALAPASGKGGRGLNGDMDEVRLRAGALSADWVKADYDTVNDPNFVIASSAVASSLTVAWSEATGFPGVQRIAHDYVIIGGEVTALGDADACEIQYKKWPLDDEPPPYDWTSAREGLALGDAFAASITGLRAGTAYGYELRALGDDGEEVVITGTFTTHGDSGSAPGSKETHFFNDGTNAYWVANEFERYIPFTVTGYTGTETLTNFPVLVDVRKNDTNDFTYDDFYHLGGRDIVFVDESGHVIPHEIDTWNPNGMSLIWVRLPEMNNGTMFTMCYRSPLVNPPADPGNAFERYVGVWHMNEKGNGIVEVHDSTTNNLSGETHAQSLAYSNGRIGYARRVAQHSGTSSTYGHILINDRNDILRNGVGNVFTYSCWSKLADNAPGWAYLVSRKREDADKGWGIQ